MNTHYFTKNAQHVFTKTFKGGPVKPSKQPSTCEGSFSWKWNDYRNSLEGNAVVNSCDLRVVKSDGKQVDTWYAKLKAMPQSIVVVFYGSEPARPA